MTRTRSRRGQSHTRTFDRPIYGVPLYPYRSAHTHAQSNSLNHIHQPNMFIRTFLTRTALPRTIPTTYSSRTLTSTSIRLATGYGDPVEGSPKTGTPTPASTPNPTPSGTPSQSGQTGKGGSTDPEVSKDSKGVKPKPKGKQPQAAMETPEKDKTGTTGNPSEQELQEHSTGNGPDEQVKKVMGDGDGQKGAPEETKVRQIEFV